MLFVFSTEQNLALNGQVSVAFTFCCCSSCSYCRFVGFCMLLFCGLVFCCGCYCTGYGAAAFLGGFVIFFYRTAYGCAGGTFVTAFCIGSRCGRFAVIGSSLSFCTAGDSSAFVGISRLRDRISFSCRRIVAAFCTTEKCRSNQYGGNCFCMLFVFIILSVRPNPFS